MDHDDLRIIKLRLKKEPEARARRQLERALYFEVLRLVPSTQPLFVEALAATAQSLENDDDDDARARRHLARAACWQFCDEWPDAAIWTTDAMAVQLAIFAVSDGTDEAVGDSYDAFFQLLVEIGQGDLFDDGMDHWLDAVG